LYIFNLLDTNKSGIENGLVDFRDFACFMGVLKQGSYEDRLRIAFKAYDIDGDGFLDRVGLPL
jgi:Ca2+-binding EF-hand superfamily protein